MRHSLLIYGTVITATATAALSGGAFGAALRPGFNSNTYGGNDDGSVPCVSTQAGTPSGCLPTAVPIGFDVNFYGQTSNRLFLNNNGNVTFGAPLSTFTPFGLTTNIGSAIIAPFFADVDTRVGNNVTYGNGSFNGRPAFGVNWDNVGYYDRHADKLNSFQLLLVDRADTGVRNFDAVFNYNKVQWETGDASGGSGGLGGTPAHAGFSNGTGAAGSFYELPGSGVAGALLDSSASTGLVNGGQASNELGQYTFRVRNGDVVVPIPDIATFQVSGTVTSPGFAWNTSYDVGLTNGRIQVTEDIRLVGDNPGSDLRTAWERGIERVWSNRYDIVDDQGFRYPLIFDANFVGSGGDQVVTVHSGTGRANMSNWYTSMPGGWPDNRQGEIASHEFGHMVGLYDEYAGGAVNPALNPNVFSNSIMADLGPPQSRHFETLLSLIQSRTTRSLSLANSPLPQPEGGPLLAFGTTEDPPFNNDPVTNVPEPGTSSIMLAALAGLSLPSFRRKVLGYWARRVRTGVAHA